jgi:hypothetical protein
MSRGDLRDEKIGEIGEHRQKGDAHVGAVLIGPHWGEVNPSQNLGKTDDEKHEQEPAQDDQVVPEPGEEPSGAWRG